MTSQRSQRSSAKTLRVFYNSACPVCDKGCEHMRKELGPESDHHDATDIQWLDLHTDKHAIHQLSATLGDARKKLHVIDRKGHQQVGIDAFIAIWSENPKHSRKVWLLTLPVIRPLAKLTYSLFANGLYWFNRLLRRW